MSSKKQQLFDGSSDGEEEEDYPVVKINQKYAKEYQRRKQKQELLSHKGADLNSGDDDESSSEEDEDAELLTTQLDVDIFKTINALRSKDERIYDESVKFFNENAEERVEDEDSADEKQGRPKSVKDVLREQVLQDMERGQAMDEEIPDVGDRLHDDNKSRFEYDAEQEAFRRELVQASKNDDCDEDVVVVVPRKKDRKQDDIGREELLQEMEKLKSNKDEKNRLVDPKGEVKDGEAFLLDFFQNRPWQQNMEESDSDEDDDEKELPMKAPRNATGTGHDDDDDSLEDLDKTDEFEAQYNFRFEETASSGVSHSLRNHSRENVDTLRRKDDRRREKRMAKQERKAAERKQKEEQLKRLKNAKRQEMEERLEKIKGVAGKNDKMDEEAVLKLLEGDFDPDKFEAIMRDTYNDSFYEQDDEEWDNDGAVRESIKADLEGDNVDDGDGDLYDTAPVEDEDGGGEADTHEEDNQEWNDEDEEVQLYEGEQLHEEEEETELEKKLRSKVEDELYKLDYEDIVAGMPTRFKYRQVEPNDYGLSTEEILLARDTSLKQFVSLKKMAPYSEREYHANARKRRKFRELLKADVEEAKVLEEKDQSDPKKKKSRRLRKGKREKGDDANVTSGRNDVSFESNMDEIPAMDKGGGKDNEGKEDTSRAAATTETVKPGDSSHTPSDTKPSASTKQQKKKRKRSRKSKVEGVSNARLASYGL